MRRLPYFAFLALASLAVPQPSTAKPSPVPGGANQIAGVQAVFPHPAFNGFVRIVPKYFGPERPSDNVIEHPSDPNMRVLIFEGVISNGRPAAYMDDPQILLADAGGITADTRSVQPNGIILQQAMAAKLQVIFWAPKDFVPDHIVYTCQATKCKAIRFLLKR
ncbi:MAG TPA: hypothetical protein VGZ02_09365 [Candidatus Baltobacteraceae bacterium]|jgi:hypothetical protein|nr:hypothetical protein [Candidatus Baltobacteraceae bacterium]